MSYPQVTEPSARGAKIAELTNIHTALITARKRLDDAFTRKDKPLTRDEWSFAFDLITREVGVVNDEITQAIRAIA